ncbi:MAG: MNIO family bufferin maturase [Gammaproteobacteria bacterium]
MLEERPPVPWFELHSENFFCAGGEMPALLEQVRRDYPISLHGVGLSLGRADALDPGHLHKLADLIARCEPALVSEHLCWGAIGHRHLNNLLPLPYTEEALTRTAEHVDAVQERLGRTILVENISSYLTWRHSCMPEWEFVTTLAQRAGCGILLDVNNIYVNSVNHGFDPRAYIDAIPPALVGEIHLAGLISKEGLGRPLLIDSHSRRVSPEVWALYRYALDHCGVQPTLIEWDADIPALEVLLNEMDHAQAILDEQCAVAA